jgi:hypothetical protein
VAVAIRLLAPVPTHRAVKDLPTFITLTDKIKSVSYRFRLSMSLIPYYGYYYDNNLVISVVIHS